MCLKYKSFENTVGKGEIAHNEQFLLYPISSVFYPLGELFTILTHSKFSSTNSFSLEESKTSRYCIARVKSVLSLAHNALRRYI